MVLVMDPPWYKTPPFCGPNVCLNHCFWVVFINLASIITVISYEQLFTIINHYQPFLTKDTFGIVSMHRFGLLQGTNALQKADGFMVSPWENIGISNCPAISTGGYFAKGNRSLSKKWETQRIPKPHGSSEPTLRPRGVAYPIKKQWILKKWRTFIWICLGI